MINLNTKVIQLNRVGRSLAGKLNKLGIETARDLIFYFPFRYDDFSQIKRINELRAGQVATVKGRLDLIANRRSYRRRKILTEGVVSDETGSIKVIWFNQPWIAKNLKPGEIVYLSGRLAGDLFDVYFNSPNYEKESSFKINTGRLVPVYSLTEGLSQKQLRFLIKSILPLADSALDLLPAAVRQREKLISLPAALRAIHFPADQASLKRARERLAFDELFLLQLWVEWTRQELADQPARPIKFYSADTKKFIASLDFKLTLDQRRAAWEILKDLQKNKPMNRLLDGDVGSGKTLVAVIAIYNAALNGNQSALMVPTEILAHQHFKTINHWLAPLGVRVGLITRSQRQAGAEKLTKKEFQNQLAAGKIAVVVGTHALIQKDLLFDDLVLVVVDEQHRFGVKQRQALKQKGKFLPHFLSLSATPIPRTLALTLYGDLDLSIIKQLPASRKKIITKVVAPEKRGLAYDFIARQIKAGRQAFVVCPLIDPSDRLGVRSVTTEFEKLDKEIFTDLNIGLLHGRLKTSDREKIMADFLDNKIKILVATSVIEVGVDIPNATVMMIEGAERFGLAQLHQFRGRVGRSCFQSYCFLFSESRDPELFERLRLMAECDDGFSLANQDLAQRGAGTVYGYEQSGFFTHLKIADLTDLILLKKAKVAARSLLVEDHRLNQHLALKEEIITFSLNNHQE